MRNILCIILLSLIIPTALMAGGNEGHIPGKLLLRVTTPFTSIATDPQTGYIITGQTWFDTLAVTWEIDDLHALYPGVTQQPYTRDFVMGFPEAFDLGDVMDDFLMEAAVERVYPDSWGSFHSRWAPNDLLYGSQWHFQNIGMEAAWDMVINTPPEDIVIAVLDSGVAIRAPDNPQVENVHPDLQGHILRDNQNNIVEYHAGAPGEPVCDDLGHGTHCAGIAAAATNNFIGVASVGGRYSPVKILPVRVANDMNQFSGEFVLRALAYVAGFTGLTPLPDVVSMSFGFDNLPADMISDFQYWIDQGVSQGIVYVASLGNDAAEIDDPTYHIPACLDNVIAVGATSADNDKTEYSNYSHFCDISAPGGDGDDALEILSTYNDIYDQDQHPYASKSGTSMSAPMVAGTLALMKMQYWNELQAGTMTLEDMVNKMYGTSTDVNPTITDHRQYGYLGAGIINVPQALDTSITPAPVVGSGSFRPGHFSMWEMSIRNWPLF